MEEVKNTLYIARELRKRRILYYSFANLFISKNILNNLGWIKENYLWKLGQM